MRSFKPFDQVRALSTLEDDRTVVVQLTGSLSEELAGAPHPVVRVVSRALKPFADATQ